ncbi:MAG TPA: SDR family oxidoreductase, partial [Bacteroidales bacterium]|nr:SDR family oxidoreductase [Bacteroidales bacterium]
DIFCCLGTTIKKAGSQEAFRKVDLEAPAKIASIAAENEVKQFIVISSIGADPGSRNFYLRTKGQMEQTVQKEHFQAVAILRPSMITGKRKEFRMAEETGKMIFRPLEKLLLGRLRKYRSIKAKTIARAMVNIALTPQDKTVFESHEIQKLAGLTGN